LGNDLFQDLAAKADRDVEHAVCKENGIHTFLFEQLLNFLNHRRRRAPPEFPAFQIWVIAVNAAEATTPLSLNSEMATQRCVSAVIDSPVQSLLKGREIFDFCRFSSLYSLSVLENETGDGELVAVLENGIEEQREGPFSLSHKPEIGVEGIHAQFRQKRKPGSTEDNWDLSRFSNSIHNEFEERQKGKWGIDRSVDVPNGKSNGVRREFIDRFMESIDDPGFIACK